MLVWGSGGNTIDCGHVMTQDCTTCERSRDYHLMLHYRYFHFYWFMGFVTKREYSLQCTVCHRGWMLKPEEAQQYLPSQKSLIPFWREYGFVTTFGVVFLSSFGIAFIQIVGQAFAG